MVVLFPYDPWEGAEVNYTAEEWQTDEQSPYDSHPAGPEEHAYESRTLRNENSVRRESPLDDVDRRSEVQPDPPVTSETPTSSRGESDTEYSLIENSPTPLNQQLELETEVQLSQQEDEEWGLRWKQAVEFVR
ncbi:hypothetical protein FRX31_023922 [Thalictrum thalictroides]|uniref:Uncharacterized protein n=1 Tax=Thalictrum thalictroides TaxID=46969 RepID=A0A7J6VP06_THATH|nr:hypothetical protein FRX31_023922 [Thalictrum thalictroides]